MPPKIDPLDREIVALLQEDGRMPSAEIARRIGNITERIARTRINRLVADGVIKVSAIARPEAVGYPVIADVWLQVEPGQVKALAHQLAAYNEIIYIGCSTGEHDISMQVCARDNVSLYRFVTETIANLPGVKKTTTVIIPLIIKDVQDWRIPSENGEGNP